MMKRGGSAAADANCNDQTGGAVMILGMSYSTFTAVHVVLSLIGMLAGAVVLFGMFGARRLAAWTALFLLATLLTSVTGFMFPFNGVLPSHIVGAISLVALAVAIVALYGYRLAGASRWIYVTGAVLSLYLNVFVGVAQAFMKVPALNALAPTQVEPPFAVAQLAVLALFVAAGAVAIAKFRPAPSQQS
jgi:hypothetical protein